MQILTATSPIYLWSSSEEWFFKASCRLTHSRLGDKIAYSNALTFYFPPSTANASEQTCFRLNLPQTFREINCCDLTHKRERKCTYPMSLQASLLAAAQLSFTHERNRSSHNTSLSAFPSAQLRSGFSKPQPRTMLQLPGPDPWQL